MDNNASKVSLRMVDASYAPTVQSLCEDCVDFFYELTGEAPSPDVGQKFFTETPPGSQPKDKGVFIICEECAPRTAIGIIEVLWRYPVGDALWLASMLVRPRYRRLGYGRAAIEALHGLAAKAGVRTIHLLAVVGSQSERFWRDLGYQFVQVREKAILGKKEQTLVEFKKSLD